MPATTSGTTTFNPSLGDILVECFSRIGMSSSELTPAHIIDGRRSMNLVLTEWSSNRGPNLAAIDLISIPMIPGVPAYTLPPDTVQLLDAYIRTFQPDTTYTTLGNTLTPVVTGAGEPVVNSYGDPAIIGPTSGVFDTVAGDQTITMTWPAHGLSVGDPVFFNGTVSTGGLVLQALYSVASVIDSDTITFLSVTPALETQTGGGATPLLQTVSGDSTVYVIYPRHGMIVGDTFTIDQTTTVGGLTFTAGTEYTVTVVDNSYQFEFDYGSNASSSTAGFINNGQFQVTSQMANVSPIDLIVWGLSRTEYASIPTKDTQSRPTSFWFDRTRTPTLYVWPVSPPFSQTGGIYYVFQAYRMREIQDANPVSGQIGDFPQRFLEAFCSATTARLAEKFAPELLQQKLLLAETAWNRASQEDRELVPIFLAPQTRVYWL